MSWVKQANLCNDYTFFLKAGVQRNKQRSGVYPNISELTLNQYSLK